MKTMYDKEERKRLIGRYLDGETTPGEERAMARFYSETDAAGLTGDERAVAAMLRIRPEAAEAEVDTEAVAEFDRLFPTPRTDFRRRLRRTVTGVAAAVAVAALGVWALRGGGAVRQAPERAAGVWSFTALCEEVAGVFPDASSINITRSGDSLLVTVRHDGGRSITFSTARNAAPSDGILRLKAVTEN